MAIANTTMTNRYAAWLRKKPGDVHKESAICDVIEIEASDVDKAVAEFEKRFAIRTIYEYGTDVIFVETPGGHLRYAFNRTDREGVGMMMLRFASKSLSSNGNETVVTPCATRCRGVRCLPTALIGLADDASISSLCCSGASLFESDSERIDHGNTTPGNPKLRLLSILPLLLGYAPNCKVRRAFARFEVPSKVGAWLSVHSQIPSPVTEIRTQLHLFQLLAGFL